jgi:hypothetical protein
MGYENSLDSAIKTNDIYIIVSQAGITLEKICNYLSFNLPIRVTRKKEDKYTLGDLFPGVFKILKRSNISEIIVKIGPAEKLCK